MRGMAKPDRGDSSISRMPGCGPNALHKNWIQFLQSVACILTILPASKKADHFCGGTDMSGIKCQI